MIDLTQNAKAASQKITTTPTIVFAIDGYDHLFGSAQISELIRIGDPDLYIGNDWVIGGVRLIRGQSAYINYGSGGTTTKISQKISPDRAQGSSISSMVVSLIDKNEEISRLISPGFELQDVLGRDCTVAIGFVETAYPEDYNFIFRGIISDVESGPGYVNFLLASSEEKKRRPLIKKGTTELQGAMALGPITSFTVADASGFPQQVNAPNGFPDPSIEFLARIDDEVFTYTTISGNAINGVTRAQAGTIEETHDDLSDVSKGLKLSGNGIDLALKIMLSGINGYFVENVPVAIINAIGIGQYIPNAIFFESIDIEEKYGITPGDWITVANSANPSNDFLMRQISAVDKTNEGSYVIVNGSPLFDEFLSPATASFRSKYDTLGVGLKMTPAEVDVARHEFIRNTFLNTFNFEFYEFDIAVTKDFIEKELYLPMACFSVPRQGRSSVTYTIGPIASSFIPTLDISNVKNASALKVRRSIASNFSNTVQYQYDYALIESKYKKVKDYENTESKTRIPVGDKLLTIQSKGMRTDLSAQSLSTLASDRLLARYSLGAEFINGVQMLFGQGYPIEIGDLVLVDYAALQLTDFNTGDRSGQFKYMEVINKTLDNKTGEVSLDLVNTSFEYSDRYGVISPSSKVDVGSTNVKINLKNSWGTPFYSSETVKWTDYINQKVIVHSPDWSIQEERTIKALGSDPESMLLDVPLSFVPLENYIIDLVYYPTSVDPEENKVVKAMHAYFSPNIQVISSTTQDTFEVTPTDFLKFKVGAVVRLNNFSYSDYSPEAKVVALNPGTNEVQIDPPTGFFITTDHEVKLIGFADGGFSYRYI